MRTIGLASVPLRFLPTVVETACQLDVIDSSLALRLVSYSNDDGAAVDVIGQVRETDRDTVEGLLARLRASSRQVAAECRESFAHTAATTFEAVPPKEPSGLSASCSLT